MQSLADPSLFTFHHGETHLILLLYVDDIVLIGNNYVALWKTSAIYAILWVLRLVLLQMAFIFLRLNILLIYLNRQIWVIESYVTPS